jgi:ribonuclease D
VDSVSYYICNKKNWREKKVAASDILPQLFLASKKTSKDAAQTLKAQKELRRSSNFKKKVAAE